MKALPKRGTAKVKALGLSVLTLLVCWIGFISCGEPKLTGGYDDVENPALTVSLRDTQGQSVVSGRVEVYAQWQNPLQDSLPLLDLEGPQGVVTVTDTQLVKAMREGQMRGIPWPSVDTVAIQLITRQGGREAFETGFLLLRNSTGTYRFYRQVSGGLVTGEKNVLQSISTLKTAMTAVRGEIGTAGQGLGLKAVFIAGSSYHAPVNAQGQFTFARMASGSFTLHAEAADGKVYSAPNALIADSTGVYQAQDWTEADVIWISP